jgi:hypothetical protein
MGVQGPSGNYPEVVGPMADFLLIVVSLYLLQAELVEQLGVQVSIQVIPIDERLMYHHG